MALVLNITQGEDYTISGALTQTSGSPPSTTPLDLTGCNLVMSIRSEDGVLVGFCATANDDGSLTITNSTGGLFTIFISTEVTALWPVETLSWDVWLLSSSNTIHTPVGRGEIYVIQAVTVF